MPIEVANTLPDGVVSSLNYVPEATWMEVNTAAAQRESVFANMIEATDRMPVATEEQKAAYVSGEFSALKAIEGTKFEGSALERFYVGLESPEQVQWQMDKHDTEISRRETIGDGFFRPLVGTVLGAVASPSSLVGGMGLLKLPVRLGAKIAATAGITAGVTAMDEFFLQQTQDMRTKEESLFAIGFGVMLGGGLGALGGSSLAKGVTPELRQIDDIPSFTLQADAPGGASKTMQDISLDDYNVIMNDKALSAEQKTLAVHEKQGENYQVANAGAVKVASLGGLLNKLAPDMYMATSSSSVMRRIAGKMLNAPLELRGNKKGWTPGTSLDSSAARFDQGVDYRINKAVADGHKEFIKSTGKISRMQFDRLVQKAVAEGGSDIPSISKAAKVLDEEGIAVGRRAVREGILDGDESGNPLAPKGDKSWFQRTWSSNYALRTDEIQYANTLSDLHIKQLERHAKDEAQKIKAKGLPDAKAKLDELNNVTIPKMKADLKTAQKGKTKLEQVKLKNEYKKALTKTRKEAKKKEPTPAQDAYKKSQKASGRESIVNRYRGMHKTVRSGDGLEAGGSTMRVGFDGDLAIVQSRTVDIPTKDIPDEFLEGDAVIGFTRAIKRLNRQLMLKEDSRFGDDTMKNFKDELYDEFNAKRAILDAKGKSTSKLAKQHERNLSYINGILKEYYGIRATVQNEMLRNVGQSLKMFSVVTKLGSVMAATLPEIAAGLNTVGVRGYMRHVSSWVTNSAEFRAMTRQQKLDYSMALDSSSTARLAEMGEFDAGMGTKMRAANKATDIVLDKAFGLGIWTRQITAQTGIMIQAKIGRLMLKNTLSSRDVIDLARMGIGEDMIKLVRKEVRASHKKIGGTVDMRVGDWQNKSLAQDVIDAVFAEVDNTIIKPRTGATPFIGKGPTASVFMQFKQFLIASTSRYWISDVQRLAGGDIRAAERMVAFMGMGALSWKIKKQLYGQGDKEETTKEQIQNALSHGGGLGVAMEFFNLGDQMIFGDNTRYAGNRTSAGMFFGPGPTLAADTLTSAATLAKMLKGDDITRGSIRQMRRVIPMNNWIPARPLFNMAEDKLYDAFGKRQ